MISDQNAFKVDCCSPKCEWAATAACFDRKMLLISTPSVPTMPIRRGRLFFACKPSDALSQEYTVHSTGSYWLHIYGQFLQDGKNGQNLAFLKKFLKLCCDQNVWFLQLFSTVLMRFCPLQSKNVFVLVLAHLEPLHLTWKKLDDDFLNVLKNIAKSSQKNIWGPLLDDPRCTWVYNSVPRCCV